MLGAVEASADPELMAPRNPGPLSLRISRPHDLGEGPWIGRRNIRGVSAGGCQGLEVQTEMNAND